MDGFNRWTKEPEIAGNLHISGKMPLNNFKNYTLKFNKTTTSVQCGRNITQQHLWEAEIWDLNWMQISVSHWYNEAAHKKKKSLDSELHKLKYDQGHRQLLSPDRSTPGRLCSVTVSVAGYGATNPIWVFIWWSCKLNTSNVSCSHQSYLRHPFPSSPPWQFQPKETLSFLEFLWQLFSECLLDN